MEERQFLPDSLSHDFQHATVNYGHGKTKKLVSKSSYLLSPTPINNMEDNDFFNKFTPNILIFCIVIIVITSTLLQKKSKYYYLLTHYVLWLVTGLCGFILTAMIFSQHPTVGLNLQIFILNPLNLLLLFPKIRYKRNYQLLIISCYAIGCIGSFFQTFADGIQLLAFVLLITSVMSFRVTQNQHQLL